MTVSLEAPPAPVELAVCEFCDWECEPVELQPGPSGDPCCSDCLTTFAGASLYAY
jgi:hypothetical protein